MPRYICLLRSVNVSGVNIIKMAELKAFFESSGFKNVMTYIQSGNIIFDAVEKPSAAILEEKIQQKFNTKNVAVMFRTPEELAAVVRGNPFKDLANFDIKKLYVHYLENIPDAARAAALNELSFEGEFFHIGDRLIYVYYNADRRKAKLSNVFFEKKLGTRATARNWNTTSKLLLLAEKT